MNHCLNRLTKEEAAKWDAAFDEFCKTGVWDMTEEFKIGDKVEVIIWNTNLRKNWVIVEFASNNSEAVLRHFYNGSITIVSISKLKHQEIIPT